MIQNSKGFTLIELVMVIVILGILAAVAIPKFSDLSTDARQAALQGAVGAAKSGVVSYMASNDGNFPDSLGSSADSGRSVMDITDFFIIPTAPAGGTQHGTALSARTTESGSGQEQILFVSDRNLHYVQIAYDSTSGGVRSGL